MEDQDEIALVDGVYDPLSDTWSDEQRRKDCMEAMRECVRQEVP